MSTEKKSVASTSTVYGQSWPNKKKVFLNSEEMKFFFFKILSFWGTFGNNINTLLNHFNIFDSIFDQYSTRYSTRYLTRGWVTRPRSIKFTIRLQLDLGRRHLVFASTTNLESARRNLQGSSSMHMLFSLQHPAQVSVDDIPMHAVIFW